MDEKHTPSGVVEAAVCSNRDEDHIPTAGGCQEHLSNHQGDKEKGKGKRNQHFLTTTILAS